VAARTAGYTFTVSVITCISCLAKLKNSWLELFPVRRESGTTIVFLIDTCYVTASEVVHLFNAVLNPVLISGIGYGSVRKHLMTFSITPSESEELADFTFLLAVVPTRRCRTVAFLPMLVCIVSLSSTTVPSA
jgi:hypothetical protein